MSTYDTLVVGAGFTGAVLAERIASQLDKRVLVIDRRKHIAGNAHDRIDEHGVLIHDYGPHLFHTNSRKVWEYLSRFTDWHPYEHRVLADIDGTLVPVPFNLKSLHLVAPSKQASQIEKLLRSFYGMESKIPILKMKKDAANGASGLSPQQAADFKWLADFIYEKIFLGYTTKQWGQIPEELGPSITSRVPVLVSYDDRYFQDKYQALPASGYTKLIRRILDHPKIEIELGQSFKTVPNNGLFDQLIYTGPLDEYCNYVHGPLPYRSLHFEFEHYDQEFYQQATQVNFPNAHAYTRITEFKHATGQATPGTTIVKEFPQNYVIGENEPYYPVPLTSHRKLHSKYVVEASQSSSNAIFAGRLADYKYYNMDQAVARALAVFEKQIAA